MRIATAVLHKNTVVGGIATVTTDIFAPSQMSMEDQTEVPLDSAPASPVVPAMRRRRVVAPRGRFGIDELAQIVGSRRQRDIKRSTNFMPGAFEEWNSKQPKGKYWGGYQDVDDDGYAHEFVVRRGDSEGPMIAVNGYTTKGSDWPMRSLYYEKYPTRDDRAELPQQNRMRYAVGTIYEPDYENGLTIKKWGIEPGSENDVRRGWREKWRMNVRYPKNLSPYQGFNKYIMQPAIDHAITTIAQSRGLDKATYKKKLYKKVGVGTFSKLIKLYYDKSVNDVIFEKLSKSKEYESLQKQFEFMKQQYDPYYEFKMEDFYNWYIKQKAVKTEAADLVTDFLADLDKNVDKVAKGLVGIITRLESGDNVHSSMLDSSTSFGI